MYQYPWLYMLINLRKESQVFVFCMRFRLGLLFSPEIFGRVSGDENGIDGFCLSLGFLWDKPRVIWMIVWWGITWFRFGLHVWNMVFVEWFSRSNIGLWILFLIVSCSMFYKDYNDTNFSRNGDVFREI